MNDLDVFVFLLNVYFHLIDCITLIPRRYTWKFRFFRCFRSLQTA
jgi:hypothetical protein